MKEPLYAVWKYSSFPYYLCAEVEQIDNDGYVKTKGYGSSRFKPVTLLYGNQGERFIKHLRAAKTTQRDMQKGLHNAACDALRKNLTDFGVSCGNVPAPGGYMYPVFGKAFQQGIEDIMESRAPDFAWIIKHDSMT